MARRSTLLGVESDGEPAESTDPAMGALLDHIAAELAAEYVRLMEAAADREGESAGLASRATEGHVP